MSWEVGVLVLGALIAGLLVGSGLGYTRGRVEGRVELVKELVSVSEAEELGDQQSADPAE